MTVNLRADSTSRRLSVRDVQRVYAPALFECCWVEGADDEISRGPWSAIGVRPAQLRPPDASWRWSKHLSSAQSGTRQIFGFEESGVWYEAQSLRISPASVESR